MNERHSRQSFLGDKFLSDIESIFVSIVGLGGGGSIVGSELAHIGFKKYFICDYDNFEESNINRNLGSRYEDIKICTPKIEISERTIRAIVPDATIISKQKQWQSCIDLLEFQNSKVIFSCLDNFINRVQVEAFARKYRIPLIDIGLTVKQDVMAGYQTMGQVVLSHPNGPCFKCYGFITDKDLENEEKNYGDAGIRPQVIWANGILASAAVGLGVELLSGWTQKPVTAFYKHLDGNLLRLTDNLKVSSGNFDNNFKCSHFNS